MAKPPVYARFLHTLNCTKQSNPDPAFDGCEDILAYIAVSADSEKPAKITDLVQSLQYGTGPTVHRKVTTLVKRGYLSMEKSTTDARSKSLRLTDKGNNFLKERSKMMKALFESAQA